MNAYFKLTRYHRFRLGFFAVSFFLCLPSAFADCPGSFERLFHSQGEKRLPPLIAQVQDQNCGPASVRSFLLSRGIDVSETNLALLLKTTALSGTEAQDLVRVLEHFGFRAEFKQGLTWQDLKLAQSQQRGILINYQLEGEGHWALVANLQKQITLMDPWVARSERYRVISESELLKDWRGFNEGVVTPRAAVIISPGHVLPH